jgi:UDP-glucose 4-epimerase
MRIAVTGGLGFIGSNLCNYLKKEHDVIAYDNEYIGVRENTDCAFRSLDVTDYQAVYEEFISFKPEVVVHLAAASSSPMFKEAERWALNTNIMGFVNVVHHARKQGAQKVVYASSSSLYNGEIPPWIETALIEPQTFYECSFHAREEIAASYLIQYGYPTVGMRFFSVYGPNERHKCEFANNLTQFLWDISNDKPPIIYGDGTQTRDFIHVEDVCKAIERAILQEPRQAIYNVGTGINTSFNDICALINKKLGKEVKPNYIPNPVGRAYIDDTLADTKMAELILGFKSKISVAEGIERQIRAYPASQIA